MFKIYSEVVYPFFFDFKMLKNLNLALFTTITIRINYLV